MSRPSNSEFIVEAGLLRFDRRKIIGSSNGTYVYSGSYKDKENCTEKAVAIKRRQSKDLSNSDVEKEIQIMNVANNHPNFLHFIRKEEKGAFIYVAMHPVCQRTLDDYVTKNHVGPRFTNDIQVVIQVTEGLAHFHKNGIVHLDIKPANILVFVPEGVEADPQVKLADFDSSQTVSSGSKTCTNTSNTSGTIGWMAPESYSVSPLTVSTDIHSLGCVVAYVLSGGIHPFGRQRDESSPSFGDDPYVRQSLINKGEIKMKQKDLVPPYSKQPKMFQLIQSMLDMDPKKRPTAAAILDDLSKFLH